MLSFPLCVCSLKAVLSAPPSSGALDLSGIPLTARDMERLCSHLQRHASTVVSLELGFTELTDEAFLLLLPTLAALPHLETLALNGNRLTRAVLKELTDALKVFLRFDYCRNDCKQMRPPFAFCPCHCLPLAETTDFVPKDLRNH